MAERRRLYKVINVVDLGGFGSTHLKGNTMMSWFKQYAACFGLNYPEASSRRPNPRLQRCPPLPIDRYTESTALLCAGTTRTRGCTYGAPHAEARPLAPHLRCPDDVLHVRDQRADSLHGHMADHAQLPPPGHARREPRPYYPPDPRLQPLCTQAATLCTQVTAAKISVSSWGHESAFERDGIALFRGSIKDSLQPWRSVAANLASTHDLATLSAGCYTPPEDVAALAALQVYSV